MTLSSSTSSPGQVVDAQNDIISRDKAKAIEALENSGRSVRSPLTCESKTGVAKCCGLDLSHGRCVELRKRRASSPLIVGEPGTQRPCAA